MGWKRSMVSSDAAIVSETSTGVTMYKSSVLCRCAYLVLNSC